jgi:hypothetical protein
MLYNLIAYHDDNKIIVACSKVFLPCKINILISLQELVVLFLYIDFSKLRVSLIIRNISGEIVNYFSYLLKKQGLFRVNTIFGYAASNLI